MAGVPFHPFVRGMGDVNDWNPAIMPPPPPPVGHGGKEGLSAVSHLASQGFKPFPGRFGEVRVVIEGARNRGNMHVRRASDIAEWERSGNRLH